MLARRLALAALALAALAPSARAAEWVAGAGGQPQFRFCADPTAHHHRVWWTSASGIGFVDVPGGQRENLVRVRPHLAEDFRVVVDSLLADGTGWRSEPSLPYKLSPDMNGDGIVGAQDFGYFRAGYLKQFSALDFQRFRDHYLQLAPAPVATSGPINLCN